MIIETERLVLRPFIEDDSEDVYEYLKEPAFNCFACMKLNSVDEAKEEMIERLDEYFVDEINYYKELREILEELGKKRMKSVSA